jgi:hypothetical protein
MLLIYRSTSMALDGDDMNRLIRDAVLGKKEPSIKGDDATAFFDKVKKQVAEMIAKGQSPDMLLN